MDPSAWFTQIIDLTQAPDQFYGGADDGVLHLPIAAVSLTANNVLWPIGSVPADNSAPSGLVGVAGVDHVVAWDTLPASLDPNAPPSSAAFPERQSRHGLGVVSVHFTSDDRALDIIADAGMTLVRGGIEWQTAETVAGTYDFTALDPFVASLEARGLKLLFLLCYFNPLYPGPADPAFSSTTVPAFAAFAKAVATHLSGHGVIYEVWNEEDGDFWPPPPAITAPNPGQYAQLSMAAIAAVHSVDPQAMVTLGGLQGFDSGISRCGCSPSEEPQGSTQWPSTPIVLEAARASPTSWRGRARWSHPRFRPRCRYGTASKVTARSTTPTAGARTTPTAWALQAQRVSRELLSAWAVGFPVVRSSYDIKDDSSSTTDEERQLRTGPERLHRQARAISGPPRTLTGVAKGRVAFEGFLPVGFTSIHAMLFVGAQDRVVALWRDTPGSVTAVEVPPNAAAMDMLGAPLALESEGGATQAIRN